MIDEAEAPKTDFYLKLVSKASMPSVLSAFYDDGGMAYPEMEALDGWHVNIRLSSDAMRDVVEALDVSHGVTPDAPKRVWL